MDNNLIDQMLDSRRRMLEEAPPAPKRVQEAEGGCGVVGLAASFPVAGRHLVPAARQMHNRGNGKGGGLAAAGLSPRQMRVSPEVLREATLLQVAYLDPEARADVEETCLGPAYDILQGYAVPTLDEATRQAILRAGWMCKGRVTEMAELLRVSRTTLWRHMKQYNITTDYFKS